MNRAIAISLVACGCHAAPASTSDGSVAGSAPDAPAPLDAALDAPPDAAFNDYNVDGPESVTTFTVTVTTPARSFTENVYLPGAAGLHPVVILSPGLQQPAAAYHDYGHRLASYGIITLVRDDPGILENSADVATDISYVVATWLPAITVDASSMLAGRVDLAHVGMAGHSRGGKSSLIAIELGAAGKVQAWFGLDPVDAAFINGGIQARDTIASIAIPTAFLGTTAVGVCNAVADNYQVLYAAAPAPSVALTAVGAGHTQLEDPASCVSCNICAPGTADGQVVLAYSVRYLTAFFARELLGDSHVGPVFEGAGATTDIAAGLITLVSK